MSKLDTSWIKWGNTDPTYSISHDINRLRQLINDALAEMSSNANSGFVQLYNTGKFNTIFSEDIVKQCTKELRKKGFWTIIDDDILFIYRGLRMTLFGK